LGKVAGRRQALSVRLVDLKLAKLEQQLDVLYELYIVKFAD